MEEQAISRSVATLLTRNLHEVFGENDPERRRAAIEEIFADDAVFHESSGVYRGWDEIDRIAGAIKSTGTWNLGTRAGDFIYVAGMRGIDPKATRRAFARPSST